MQKISIPLAALCLICTSCSSHTLTKPLHNTASNSVQFTASGTEVIEVPFTPQAPEADWSEPWLNACEETSIVMISNFYQDDPSITVEEAKAEILRVFDLKEKILGESKDESVESIHKLISATSLPWKTIVKDNITREELQIEVANKRPIIISFDARKIDNPYYGENGPDYHVAVLNGYNEDTSSFIINDPGTSRGENFEVPYQTLLDALSDINTTTGKLSPTKKVLFTSVE